MMRKGLKLCETGLSLAAVAIRKHHSDFRLGRGMEEPDLWASQFQVIPLSLLQCVKKEV